MADTSETASITCETLRPLLAAYALGDAQLDAPARAHLQSCPECRRALSAYAGVARLLPFEAPEETPPAHLRSRLIAAVQAEAAAREAPAPDQPAQPPALPRREPTPRRSSLVALWASLAAAAAIIIALLGWNLALQRQVQGQAAQLASSREGWQTLVVLMNRPDLEVSRLSSGSVLATVWSAPNEPAVCVMAEGLPEPYHDNVYQVWLRDEDGWVSAGTFEARSSNQYFLLRLDEAAGNYSAIRVTSEPAGGSAEPSGKTIVEGALGAQQA
jgi:hypothetical protein